MTMKITALGGPTALIELGGLRILTDPTFDEPGEYPIGDRALTKTLPSATSPDELGGVDLVLLSHDQHPDNLDKSGRAYLDTAPVVFTTGQAVGRLGGAAVAPPLWEAQDVRGLRVTRVPALHGPEGAEPVTGEVCGFVLAGAGLPTVYVSGDNASLRLVGEIADRCGPVDVAVLFAGAARTTLFDGALLTIDSAQAAEATRVLRARHAVPLHHDSWGHFTEGAADLTEAFEKAGLTDRLTLLAPGEHADLT